MESLLFLGVPILKHNTVALFCDKVQTGEKFFFIVYMWPCIQRSRYGARLRMISLLVGL